MIINSTFLVQAFHFFCAYLMLRLLLFKPTIAVIEQEDNEEQRLIDGAAEHRVKEREYYHAGRREWALCQQFFVEHRPLIGRRLPLIRKTPIASAVLSQQELSALEKEIEQAVVARVEHVWR